MVKIPLHIISTPEKILYVISKLEKPTFNTVAEEVGMKYANSRAVMKTLVEGGSISFIKDPFSYKAMRVFITDQGAAEVAKMTPDRFTNAARTDIILDDAKKGTITVMSLLNTHYSESNRGNTAVQNIYQRLLLMVRDGLIEKQGIRNNMANSEYAITERGRARLEGRDLNDYPITRATPAGERRDRFIYGVKVVNPKFRIAPRGMKWTK